MTELLLPDRIRQYHKFLSNSRFSAKNIAADFGVPVATIRPVLDQMHGRGEIRIATKCRHGTYFVRAVPNTLMRQPWRIHTNEELFTPFELRLIQQTVEMPAWS